MTTIKLNRAFKDQAKGMIESHYFDVGILVDKNHRLAKSKNEGLKNFPKGKARKTGKNSGMTISEVSKSLRRTIRKNFYTLPFKNKKNKEIIALLRTYFKFVIHNQGNVNRLKNTAQAIVRNPILRGDYGRNTNRTANIKGFNKLMVDTGQLFKNITSKVVKKVSLFKRQSL